MKKHIAILVLMTFIFNLCAYAGSLDAGARFLEMARKANANHNEKEEMANLAKAYENFAAARDADSIILLVFTSGKLHRESETAPVAVEFIKQNRSGYAGKISKCPFLLPTEKELVQKSMAELEQGIPFIDDVAVQPDTFYPYRDQQPALTFNLHANALCTLNIDAIQKQSQNLAKGNQALNLFCLVNDINKTNLNLELNAQNALAHDTKKMNVKICVNLPDKLVYQSDTFSIAGKQLLPESTVATGRALTGLGVASIMVGVPLILTGIVGLATYNDNDFLSLNFKGLNLIPIGIGALMVIIPLLTRKKTRTPDDQTLKENIMKNKQLRSEIEKLKKDVAVKQTIENTDDSKPSSN